MGAETGQNKLRLTLNRKSKKPIDCHSMKGHAIRIQNHNSLKSYQLKYFVTVFLLLDLSAFNWFVTIGFQTISILKHYGTVFHNVAAFSLVFKFSFKVALNLLRGEGPTCGGVAFVTTEHSLLNTIY